MPEPGGTTERTGVDARLPGARFSLALLLAINLVNYIDRYILSAVEPYVRAEFFAKDDPDAKFWMGTLATAFLVTYMITAPVFGWLADRWNRWGIIGSGVLLWSLATGATGLAWSFSALVAFRILVGVGEAAWGPTAPTVIADMYPRSVRGYVMSWFYVALPVGSALGFVLGGQMVHLASWHWAFFVALPPGILLGVLSFFRKDPPRGAFDGLTHKQPLRLADAARLLRNRSYVLNTAGMTAMTFAIGGMSFWMPTYIHEFRMHGTADESGQATLARVTMIFGAITVVCGLAGTILGGWLGDRLRGRLRGAYFAFSGWTMLGAFPLFLGMLWTPFPWAWALAAGAVFMAFLNTGPTNTITANVTHPGLRATAYALNIFTIHALGDAVSPPIVGLVSGRTGSMNAGFLVVGVMMLVAGVLWLLGARHLDTDTAAASGRG
jgi:MFS family permease